MSGFPLTPNSERIPVSVVGSSTFGIAHKISSAYTLNMYISDEWLVNYAGYKKAIELTGADGEGRGLFHSTRSNVMVAIVGANVYVIDDTSSVTLLSTHLNTQTGEIIMDENLNAQVCITDGLNAYILNLTKPYSLTVQTDMSGPLSTGDLIPNYVCFHDTFFLIGNANQTSNGAKWYAYSYASATTISMTTQLALQTKPDYAVAIKPIPSQANNVLVFGTTVGEIQQNIGGTQNYRRSQSSNVDFGCLSIATIASSDKYIVWLGVNEANSPVIMVFTGQGAAPISTDGIDYVLGTIEFPNQSTALFYRQNGHLFYQLTFFNKADNLTLVYDFNTQKFFHLSDQYENYHPARQAVYFNNTTYFISKNNGDIYEMSTSITYIDENAVSTTNPAYDNNLVYAIPRTRITDSIRKADSGRFRTNLFVFTMVQGDDPRVTGLSIQLEVPNPIITENDNVPIISENGIQIIAEQNIFPPQPYDPNQYLQPLELVYRPRVDISISKDAGTTFGNTFPKPLNPIGKRKNIIKALKMGLSNDITFKLRFWGLGSFVIGNGEIQVY
jgi:hypothetical protein